MPTDRSNTRKLEAEYLANLDLPDLYGEFYVLQFPHAGVSGEDNDDKKERGRRLFYNIRDEIEKIVCPQQEALLKKSNGDHVLLIITIADVLAAAQIGFPPLIISAIVTRIGIKNLCKEY